MNRIKRTPMASPARQRPTFKPHPEMLEDRCVPAVNIGVDPADASTLLITGDIAADQVCVTYNDGQLFDTISVESANGTQVFAAQQLDTIRVDLKGGDDVFLFQTESNPYDVTFDMRLLVNTGAGNDQVSFDMVNTQSQGLQYMRGNLRMNVNTGVGNDTLAGDFAEMANAHVDLTANLGKGNDSSSTTLWGNLNSSTAMIDVAGGKGMDTLSVFANFDANFDLANSIDLFGTSALGINLRGENGADTMQVVYGGQVDGYLSINADGGAGSDSADVDVLVREGSTGSVAAYVSGAAGADSALSLDITDQTDAVDNPVIDAVLDGGSGTDVGSSSGDVMEVNLEG